MNHLTPHRKDIAMRRILALVTAAGSTLAAGLLIAATATAAPAAHVVRVGVSADAPQPCAQLPAHTAYVCITTDAFKGYWSADYWMDEAYMRTMAWHPADGLYDVSETYFCRPGTVVIGGHVQSVDQGETFEPGATVPNEQWCERGAPGVPAGLAEWQARTITVMHGKSGCVVYAWKVTDNQEPPPSKPSRCLDQGTGKMRSMTTGEVASVLDFWRSMELEPGAW